MSLRFTNCALAFLGCLGVGAASWGGEPPKLDEWRNNERSALHFETLITLIPKYEKTPPMYAKAFHQAVADCLADEALPVIKLGLRAATKVCGCYHCREALVTFEFRYKRLTRDKRTATLGEAYSLVHMALLEADLAGYFIALAENDIFYTKREDEQKIVFLRQQYWTHHGTGDVAEWVVRKLALLNHPQAAEALADIQKETERITKDSKGWADGEFRDLVKRAMWLNQLIVKAGALPKGLEAALQEEDWGLCSWAANEAQQLGAKEGAPILKAALAHHRDAYEKDKKEIHWRIRNLLLDRLEDMQVAVDEKEINWGPPRLPDHWK